VAALAHKSDAEEHLLRIIRQAQTKTGRTLKQLHTDGGKEFLTRKLIDELELEQGTHKTHTPAHTSQRNPFAERAIQLVEQRARTLLVHAGLPEAAWVEACESACYLLNRTPRRKAHPEVDELRTPIELLTGVKPSAGGLRPFGCDVLVHVPSADSPGKMHPRAKNGVFVGYDVRQLAYRCLVDERIVVSRDCTFLEQSFSEARQLRRSLSDAAEEEEERLREAQAERIRQAAAPPSEASRRASRAANLRRGQAGMSEETAIEIAQLQSLQDAHAQQQRHWLEERSSNANSNRSPTPVKKKQSRKTRRRRRSQCVLNLRRTKEKQQARNAARIHSPRQVRRTKSHQLPRWHRVRVKDAMGARVEDLEWITRPPSWHRCPNRRPCWLNHARTPKPFGLLNARSGWPPCWRRSIP
jgi:hypothetical protein